MAHSIKNSHDSFLAADVAQYTDAQAKHEALHATVRHIPHSNYFDVWIGNGWANYSRVLVKPNFKHVMNGAKIPKEVLNQIDFNRDDRLE